MAFKAAFHIDELSKWNLPLRNVRNLTEASGLKNALIEVLANSEAAGFYAGPASDTERNLTGACRIRCPVCSMQ